MFCKKEFYNTVEMGHIPMAIISPLLDEQGNMPDFRIEYVNRYFSNITSKEVCVNQKLSEVITRDYPNREKFVRKLFNLPKNQCCTLPLDLPDSETNAVVTINKTTKEYIILTFSNTTQKSNELSMENAIREQLFKAEIAEDFELYFQPQYYLKTHTIRGFEALIRWQEPTLGLIKPDNFIRIAEESNLIVSLGWWIMETAVSVLKIWQTQNKFKGVLSVNVSAIQLKEKGFLQKFFALLYKYDICPKSLEIEITETVLIDDLAQTVQLLASIRDAGVLIALDDFGMGYSSLRYLQQIPVTTLKIDKSLIDTISIPNNVSAHITSTIIELAKKLKIETIAEGVETCEQFEMLKAMDCTVAQGFLCGKPMKQEFCEELL